MAVLKHYIWCAEPKTAHLQREAAYAIARMHNRAVDREPWQPVCSAFTLHASRVSKESTSMERRFGLLQSTRFMERGFGLSTCHTATP